MAEPHIEAFVTEGLGDSSYLIASGGEAAVIDAQRDVSRLLRVADANGWRIRAVLETHVHNDYVSGALEIRAATGADLLLPAGGGYEFDHRPVAEGDDVQLGDLVLSPMHTPGHTPEHTAWLVIPATGGADTPIAVFTGGSLMVGSAGRTDLLGADRAEGLARAQFASLRRLRVLPPGTRVLPTHGAGSFCGSAGEAVRRTSTIGEERDTNPALGHVDVEAFISDRLSGLLEYPAYYRYMAGVNRRGPALLASLRPPLALAPADAESAMAAGATLVDGRSRFEFARGHVPGSLNVELDEQFASYVGWLVPWDAPLVIVLPDPEPARGAMKEAVTQLHGIGFDHLLGHLDGSVEAWAASGRPVRSYPTATASDLAAALRAAERPNGDPFVLDVRQPTEWAEGAIPGSRRIFVGDLPGRTDESPADRETWVICRTGHRATMAASILDGRGVPVRVVAEGGVPDVLASAAAADANRERSPTMSTGSPDGTHVP